MQAGSSARLLVFVTCLLASECVLYPHVSFLLGRFTRGAMPDLILNETCNVKKYPEMVSQLGW